MQNTYEIAITQVFQDEGGYTNDPHDPGGPTNWGITIQDARQYWKPEATAYDVQYMPKSVAEDIYVKHYATSINYNSLPSGVDYAVLDYSINSGTSRSVRALQSIVGTPSDGVMGPITLAACQKMHPADIINQIYDRRLAFLKGLSTWPNFGKGWTNRCVNGRKLALELASQTVSIPTSSAKVSFIQLLIQFFTRIFH